MIITQVTQPLPLLDSGKFLTNNGSSLSWADVSGGATNHATLTNLDYAHAGHTGFQPAIDQNVNTGGSPEFAGLKIDNLNGIAKITDGIVSAGNVIDCGAPT